jgi:hypothetical protein
MENEIIKIIKSINTIPESIAFCGVLIFFGIIIIYTIFK